MSYFANSTPKLDGYTKLVWSWTEDQVRHNEFGWIWFSCLCLEFSCVSHDKIGLVLSWSMDLSIQDRSLGSLMAGLNSFKGVRKLSPLIGLVKVSWLRIDMFNVRPNWVGVILGWVQSFLNKGISIWSKLEYLIWKRKVRFTAWFDQIIGIAWCGDQI